MKTFRLFISSPFADFKRERDAIQEKVLPVLMRLCHKHGFGFMPIDLRWGVAEEAQWDQRTMELCLNEVKACKAEPHPDFVILVGNRYGWIPLPYMIEKAEFEEIYQHIGKADQAFVMEWYRLDENEIPAGYALQKREGGYGEYEAWERVESRLRDAIQGAVEKTGLGEEQKEKYFLSATEREFREYIQDFSEEKKECLLVIDREIESNRLESGKFFDNHKERLACFKQALKQKAAKENVLELRTNLEGENISKIHIPELVEKLTARLSAIMRKEIERLKDQKPVEEQGIQEYHKNQLACNILGRDKEIQDILDYTQATSGTQPLFVYGTSGIGKSSIMSKVIAKTSNARVVYRFCGISQESSSTKSLLTSVLRELGRELQQEKSEKTSMKILDREKKDTFEQDVCNALLEIQEPTILFLDALDQLGDKSQCEWLPSTLPSHIKIVVSVLYDKNYPDSCYYYNKLREKFSNFNEIQPLQDQEIARQILLSNLKEHNRTLQPDQIVYILSLYARVNSPLYLKIVAQASRYWSFKNKNLNLASSQKEAIQEYIENLTSLFHHDKMLIERVFGYLYACRGSLNESMLYEILSQDEELVKRVENPYHKNLTGKLPTAVFGRLSYQIAPFLKEDNKGNLRFFHREFGETAKSLYSYSLSQKLLAILEKMIDIDSLQEQREALTNCHLLSLTQQKRVYAEKRIQKQVKYIIEMVNKEEEWVNYYLLVLNEDGLHYHYKNDSFWAIAYLEVQWEILKTMYEKNPYRWADVYTAALNNLSYSYFAQNWVEEAIVLLEKSLSILKIMYKKNPNQWAEAYTMALSNLAFSYKAQNLLEKTIVLEEESLKILKVLYEKNPNRWADLYTTALLNLASSYKYQNRIKEAIELEEKSFKILKALYKKNPNQWVEAYILALFNLALSYKEQNRIKEAVALEDNSLKILKPLYEKNSNFWVKYYTIVMNNLAFSYKIQNQVEEAIELFEKSLRILRSLYEKNPDRWAKDYTLALSNLAVSYSKENRVEEGIILLEEVLKILSPLYKKNANFWAEAYTLAMNNLSSLYGKQNRVEEAIVLLEKSYKILTALYKKSPDRWVKYYTCNLNNLAIFYKEKKIEKEAIVLLQKSYKILKAVYKKNPDQWAQYYTRVLNNLAHLYEKQGDRAKAFEFFKEA